MSEATTTMLSRETLQAFRSLSREFGKARTLRAIDALAILRKEHSGHARLLVVTLLAPKCEHCWAYEFHRFEMDEPSWRSPDISPRTWRHDLRGYGATANDIQRIRADLAEGAGPSCIRCGATIIYWEDDVYVERVGLGEYIFGEPDYLDTKPRRRTSRFLRKALWIAYDRKCAACDAPLKFSEVTIDHILPEHAGGDVGVENLQPMHEECNSRKGGVVPEEVHLTFAFPLIPGGPIEQVMWG